MEAVAGAWWQGFPAWTEAVAEKTGKGDAFGIGHGIKTGIFSELDVVRDDERFGLNHWTDNDAVC